MKNAFTKILSVILVAAFVFGVGAAGIGTFKADAAEDVFLSGKEGMFYYSVKNGKATVDDIDETMVSTVINIPETLGGYPVTAIGFLYLYEDDAINEIVIPETVEEIEHLTDTKKITVDSDNKFFSTDEHGVLFNKDKTKLIKYPNLNEAVSYTIPDGIKTIGENALNYCSSIQSLIVPDSVTTIEWDAISDCENLESVELPDTITEFGSSNFRNTKIYGEEYRDNGVLYIDGYLVHVSETAPEKVVIKEDTILIAKQAFSGSNVKEAVIPEGMTKIDAQAFCGAISLEKIDIPESVTEIDDGAFSLAQSLKNVTIPASVSKMGAAPFIGCVSLEYVDVDSENKNYYADKYGILYTKDGKTLFQYPSGNMRNYYDVPETVEEIAVGAFGYATNLKGVSFSDNINTIGMAAFIYCSDLEKIEIPEKVKKIEYGAFHGCSSLTEVILPETLSVIGEAAFGECVNLEKINFPKELKTIEGSAFGDCYSLKQAVIPYGAETVASNTFSDCKSLDKIEIPDTVTHIGSNAFSRSGLSEITIPSSVKVIEWGAFSNCERLEKVNLSEGLVYIGKDVFSDCNQLEAINIPSTVSYIYISDQYFSNPFINCYSLKEINIAADNKYYSSEDGVLFNKDKTVLYKYPSKAERKVYTIPDTVTEINAEAFQNIHNTLSVIVPSSVEVIGSYNFTETNVMDDYMGSDRSVFDIYYRGTEEEWSTMVSQYYEPQYPQIGNIDVHYNYKDDDHVHEYNVIITDAPICCNSGWLDISCDCGLYYENLPADFTVCVYDELVWTETKASTCSENGVEEIHCKTCGNNFEFALRKTPKIPHETTFTVTPASDNDEGAITYSCVNCDYTYSERIPAGAKYVIFDNQSEETAAFYYPGEAVKLPETPVKSGVDFLGWADENGTVVDISVMPDENLELTASFGKNLSNKTPAISATFDEDCFSNVSDISKVQLEVVDLGVENDNVSGGEFIIKDENGKSYERIGFYDIKMTYEGGPVKFNAGKTVKIKLPVTGNESVKQFVVVHRFTEGGRENFYIDNPSEKYENGFVVIEVSKFSEFEVYALTDKEPVTPGVRLVSAPSKTKYTYKTESMDLSGIAVEITKADGTKETVTDTSKMKVVGFDNTKIGTQAVTVECEGQIVQFEVSVSYAWWQWIIRILFLGFLWY